jgi:hypothetical protein
MFLGYQLNQFMRQSGQLQHQVKFWILAISFDENLPSQAKQTKCKAKKPILFSNINGSCKPVLLFGLVDINCRSLWLAIVVGDSFFLIRFIVPDILGDWFSVFWNLRLLAGFTPDLAFLHLSVTNQDEPLT